MENPVLSRPDAFTPAQPARTNPYAAQTANNPYATQPNYYGDQSQGYAGYGQPTPNPYGAPPAPYSTPNTAGLMTYDGVIQKTAVILLVVAGVAYASAMLVPLHLLLPVGLISGLVTIVFPFIAAFRRSMGAPLALAYALFEGVFLGAVSTLFETYYPGIVVQAIFGTFVAAALVLAAFHFTGIRTSSKVSRIIRLCLMGYAGVALLSFVAYRLGFDMGMFPGVAGPVSPIAWLSVIAGVTLAVFCLLDDFTYIEKGVQMGAPAEQGWRAAFGLSVTLVWLYTQLLRLLSYINRS